jgi:large subunit ribosomal protein L17
VPHKIHERKFGRRRGPRRSMLRNLSLSVLRYERVKTTEAKAKEIRLFVDRMINLGKDGSLDARRRALAWLPEPVIVEKVFSDLAVRWPDRGSGYARITRIARRVGDGAPQMIIELVPGAESTKPTAAKAEAAEGEPKPRRRLSLPRRRAEKKEQAGAKSESPSKPRTKKTAKGAAT